MNYKDLRLKANKIRQSIVFMLNEAGSGHSAGALGLADLFSVLYFSGAMRYNVKKPYDIKRDFLFLSNGHTNPVLYASLAQAGFFPKTELKTLRKFGSRLQGHPFFSSAEGMDSVKAKQIQSHEMLPGVENSGGPLGQGISQAVGLAGSLKRDNKNNRVFCVVGDGELEEGQCWEALMWAKKEKLDNFILLVDNNNMQIDGKVDEVMPCLNLHKKLVSFGCKTIEVKGNDVVEIYHGLTYALAMKSPVAILCNTIPGKGVSFMSSDISWHGKAPNDEEYSKARKELLDEEKRLKNE